MGMVMDGRVNNRVYKDIVISIINVYIEPDMFEQKTWVFFFVL